MRYLLVILSIALLPMATFADDLIGVQYVTAYDGDTVTVNIKNLLPVFGKHLGVRLRGIDAPEMKGRCDAETARATAARDYLRHVLSSAKVLNFKDATRDKYFRLDVTIIADGVNVNQDMIEKGYARSYDGLSRQSWCHR